MWALEQIVVEIDEVEHPEVIVRIATPIGVLLLMARTSVVDRVLYLDRAHIGGLKRGMLGRAGLNAIGRKLMELADADQIVVQGSARTTGRNEGEPPRPIRFPRTVARVKP
jgi:hypothetical protein